MAERAYDAVLGLGSNVGDRVANIHRAIALLIEPGDVRLVKSSRIYRTPPWGVTDQDWFANACVTVATPLTPRALLQRCQDVENKMHRVRAKKWGPRVIDVDILTYRDETVRETDLVVPHPLIAERAFVLIPLAEIAPDFAIRGRTIDEMIAAVDAVGVRAINDSREK